jgi:polar amino acid transport system substrate-binding protein
VFRHLGGALSLAVCILVANAQADSFPSVRLLTEDDPPFNLVDASGHIGGVSTEMVREIFKRAAIPYSLELKPWARVYNMALSDKTACLYSTTRSKERENLFQWVGPLLENPWALYGGPLSPKKIHSLEDARAFTIGGYIDDAVAQYLIDRGFSVELAADDLSNVRKLAVGHIDFWATGIYHGRYMTTRENMPQLRPVLIYSSSVLYLACNRAMPDAQIQRLNQALDSMQHDGFMARVRKRYLGE